MALISRLNDLSLNRPWRTILFAWALIIAMGMGVGRLRLNMDGAALVPALHPAIMEDVGIRAAFDLKDPIVILLAAPKSESIFTIETLRRVRDWTAELQSLPGIGLADVFSLATESSDRVVPGTLRFQKWLDPLPESPEAIQTLRDSLRAVGIFHGTLIAHDESATAIMISVPTSADRGVFTAQVMESLQACEPLPEGVSLIGAPVAESLLGTHLLQDLGLPAWVIGKLGGLALDGASPAQNQDVLRRSWNSPRDLGLVPLAMLVIGAVIFISFRSPLACLLPMIKVGGCLIFVFGAMGFAGSPVYLPTAVMPVVLTVSAITEEVHLLSRFAATLRHHLPLRGQKELAAWLPAVQVPMVKTAITTAVGFLSFVAAPIEPIRDFGIWTSTGVLFSMVYSIVVTPSFFALIPTRLLFPRTTRRMSRTDGMSPASTRFFSGWGRFVVRRRRAVIALTVIAIIAAPLGIRRIVVQDSWIDGFAPDSAFSRAAHFFNERFLGMHALHVAVHSQTSDIRIRVPVADLDMQVLRVPAQALGQAADILNWQMTIACNHPSSHADSAPGVAGSWSAWIRKIEHNGGDVLLHLSRIPPMPVWESCGRDKKELDVSITQQPFLNPEYLGLLDQFETFLSTKTKYAVGGVVGPASYLKTTNFIIWGKKEGSRVIPDDPERIQWLWQQYVTSRGVERMRQSVDREFRNAVITVYLKNANFKDTARLMAEIREFERAHFQPLGMTFGFAGDVARSQGMISTVVNTPIRSVLISLVGILVVASLVGRSWRVGLLCALPSSIAVLMVFAFMGWNGVPLGVATSMFAAMTLGIGDDFAIHLMEHFRSGVARGLSRDESAVEAVAESGQTLTVDALALALGFGVLVASQVPANARLGMLLVLSLAVCWAGSLIVLPAMMATFSMAKSDARATASRIS